MADGRPWWLTGAQAVAGTLLAAMAAPGRVSR
jgi:hypothetical protein